MCKKSNDSFGKQLDCCRGHTSVRSFNGVGHVQTPLTLRPQAAAAAAAALGSDKARPISFVHQRHWTPHRHLLQPHGSK